MYELKSDTDLPLTLFINDYVEGQLTRAELSVFEECLSDDEDLSFYVNNSRKGKNALQNAFKVKAADNFEEKLARRIADEPDHASFESSANITFG